MKRFKTFDKIFSKKTSTIANYHPFNDVQLTREMVYGGDRA